MKILFKKNNYNKINAFTLIELLSVIVILAIVSIIGTVIIVDVIENSKKKALLINTESIINIFSNYKAEYRMENNTELENITFIIENNTIDGIDIVFNKKLPESGEIHFDDNGELSIYTYDGGYCAVRGPLEDNVMIKKTTKAECNYNTNSTLVSNSQINITNGVADSIKSVTIYGNSVQSDIPNEYKQLEYIESTGTQIIDTGYKLTSDNVLINIEFSSDGTASTSIFGSEAISSPKYSIIWHGSSSSKCLYVGNSGGIKCFSFTINEKNSLSTYINSSTTGTYSLNGVTSSFTYSGGLQKTRNIYIFGNNNERGGIQKSYLKVYNFSIIDNNNLVRNMIPCIRKSDNVIGMYDTVYNTFYVNAGSGTFVAGPESPAPNHPIEIQNLGYTNLFDYSRITSVYRTVNNNDGIFLFNLAAGEEYGAISIEYLNSYLMNNLGKKFTLSWKGTDINSRASIVIFGTRSNGATYQEVLSPYGANYITFTLSKDFLNITSVAIRPIRTHNSVAISKIVREIQLESGEIIHSYVPYGNYNVGIKVIGKNLSNNILTSIPPNSSNPSNYIHTYDNTTNSWTIKTCTASHHGIGFKVHLEKNQNYTLSFDRKSGATSNAIMGIHSNSKLNIFSYYGFSTVGRNKYTFSLPSGYETGEYYITFSNFGSIAANVNLNVISNIQLEKGSVMTDYEPYRETIINYPVTLRSLPDGTKDKLVIDNVNKRAYIERKVGIKALNEISSWYLRINTNTNWVSVYANNSYFINRNANNANEPLLCSHVNYLKSSVTSYINRAEIGVMGYGDSSASLMFTLPATTFPNVNKWKEFLTTQATNGTPVIVQYKLATPQTEELDYQEVQNYDGVTNIMVNCAVQPSNIEVIYLEK